MKVGLDALTLKSLTLDPLALLDQTVAHGLEGLHFSAHMVINESETYRPSRLKRRKN
jgi:hypothetical protein